MQGSHLKEIAVSFCLSEKSLNPLQVVVWLKDLIKRIGLTPVDFNINKLPPGFDITYMMKESCIYFGYWAEVGFVRMHIISCKKFKTRNITSYIKDTFKIKGKIKIDHIKDKSVKKEVKELCEKN